VGLKHLAGLNGLWHLNLYSTQVTKAGMRTMSEAAPSVLIVR